MTLILLLPSFRLSHLNRNRLYIWPNCRWHYNNNDNYYTELVHYSLLYRIYITILIQGVYNVIVMISWCSTVMQTFALQLYCMQHWVSLVSMVIGTVNQLVLLSYNNIIASWCLWRKREIEREREREREREKSALFYNNIIALQRLALGYYCTTNLHWAVYNHYWSVDYSWASRVCWEVQSKQIQGWWKSNTMKKIPYYYYSTTVTRCISVNTTGCDD